MKKITVNGVVTQHCRYLYRGYLQIACVDLTRSGHPGLWLITWDPAQPTATQPLAIQKNGTWYTCGHDLTKNVTELYNTNGTIATAYDYTPFGQVTASGTADQPIQWSSEYNDTELGLIYYNYRHYNPQDGRWINRDPIAEQGGWNLYGFVRNNGIYKIDIFGSRLFIITSFDPFDSLFSDFNKRQKSIAETAKKVAKLIKINKIEISEKIKSKDVYFNGDVYEGKVDGLIKYFDEDAKTSLQNEAHPDPAFNAATTVALNNNPNAFQFAVLIVHGNGDTNAPIFAAQNGVTIHPLMEKIAKNKNILTLACFHGGGGMKSVLILDPMAQRYEIDKQIGNEKQKCKIYHFFTSDIIVKKITDDTFESKSLNPSMQKKGKTRDEILNEFNKEK